MTDRLPPAKDGKVFPAVVAGGLVAAVLVYTVLALAGLLEGRRIDAVHLGLIALAVAAAVLAVRPEALPFKRLEGCGLKLEMLEHVRVRQDAQEHVLDVVRLTLPFLLPPTDCGISRRRGRPVGTAAAAVDRPDRDDVVRRPDRAAPRGRDV